MNVPLTPGEIGEPIGGVVPLDSPFYIARPTDDRFFAAIRRRDSIVLVKGARQTGKTSLLARGLQQARESGMRVVLTDFDALGDDALRSADTLFQTLAVMLADQLELEDDPLALWSAGRGTAMNLERFLQQKALKPFAEPLLWGLDHVDRLFSCSFGSEAFALFRSWHNRRALNPAGLWSRLTLALTYATEAHLFITDPNQSPFNVGTRLTLEDFTLEQIADLHTRYHSVLGDERTLERFFALVGGQPYLSLCGLDAMARAESETKGGAALLLSALERGVRNDDPLFGDHLRRMRRALLEDANLVAVVQQMLRGGPCPTLNDLYRLRTAGILSGDAPETARFRCRLYRDYLARELPGQ